MAQRFLASFRKLPGQFTNLRRKHDKHPQESVGEMFKVSCCGDFGFPSEPRSICYDEDTDLLALATKSGALEIYGRPGVEFHASHPDDDEVCKLTFIPNQHRLVSMTGNNSLHLWELQPGPSLEGNPSRDQLVEVARLENVAARIDARSGPIAHLTGLCATRDGRSLLVGTEGGCVSVIQLPQREGEEIGGEHHGSTLVWTPPSPDEVLDVGRITRSFSPQHRKKIQPGAVVVLLESPHRAGHFLIGYSSGVCVVYDVTADRAVCILPWQRELEDACWLKHRVITSHNDGSLAVWELEGVEIGGEARMVTPPNMPYGPFPCKTISKVIWKSTKKGDLTIFAGGMPRASYGHKLTVTLMRGEEEHACLDLTSRVVDLIVLDQPGTQEPHTLFVLCEEEVVAVDLLQPKWPLLQGPYLNCLHSSGVTTHLVVTQVQSDFLSQLEAGGRTSMSNYSNRAWPIGGGKCLNNNELQTNDLLLTGHEDGSVSFWRLSAGGCARRVYTVRTSSVFEVDGPPTGDRAETDDEVDEWPPFRKTGVFDPYSDDVRLAITCLDLVDGHLVVGGAAGQVTIWRFNASLRNVQATEANIMQDNNSNFVWKGHEPLQLRVEQHSSPGSSGMSCSALVQLRPPSKVTAMAFHPGLSLCAVGSRQGLIVVDTVSKRSLLARCTLPAAAGDDPAVEGEGWARRRTRDLKKSLRDSFRRLRRLRSSRGGNRRTVMAERSGISGATAIDTELEVAPVEREVEARSSRGPTTAVIQSLVFSTCQMRSTRHHADSGSERPVCLMAGTYGSLAMAYAVVGGSADREAMRLMQCKELTLQHGAPILEVQVLDGKTHVPIVAHDTTSLCTGHELLVVTEEQVRLFNLPNLHLKHKARLTAKDGFRIKKAAVMALNNDPGSSEPHVVLTNTGGQLVVLSLPHLRRLDMAPLLNPTDVLALNSLVLGRAATPRSLAALGLYQSAPGQVTLFEVVPAHKQISDTSQYTALCSVPSNGGYPDNAGRAANLVDVAGAGDLTAQSGISLDSLPDVTLGSDDFANSSVTENSRELRIEQHAGGLDGPITAWNQQLEDGRVVTQSAVTTLHNDNADHS